VLQRCCIGGLLILCVLVVAQGAGDADEKFNKEHKEMTDKLREKHGLPEQPDERTPESGSARGGRNSPGRGRRSDDDHGDEPGFAGDPEYFRQMRRKMRDQEREMPGGRMPRMPHGLQHGRDMDSFDMHERARRGRHDDDMEDSFGHHQRRQEEMEDHNIGKRRELTFSAQGLGLEISREWGHSHFLVDKVKGEAEKLGVKVGEAIVAVNGARTRWKNLAQVTEVIKKAGRPVKLEFGEHRPHGSAEWRHQDL